MPTLRITPSVAPLRVRHAGVPTPTPAQAGASAVGVVTAGVDTLSNYLRGQTIEQRAEALSAENIARIEAATGRAVSGAEATALLQVARAQLAQSATAPQVTSQPPASQQKSNAGVYVVGGLLVAGAVGAYFYTRRSRR